ncbi:hypothetical protein HanXRQr2_Chr07g0288351 [Helianthus annuus]|uniref:Uncharacterized protein n=1 Tax=Helianthus annuus TaxID=4232 RepID=A0A9K3NFW1_HELAN|nr:hypothetical protein HanXRQr2_Chr07g0288351 [Helianthus annuus]KAJ0904189.1 hypothetical protein HanPSC8_Chr07g0279111 [Helianthus annuus]
MVVMTAAASRPSAVVDAGGSGGGCLQLGFGYRAPDSLVQIRVMFKRRINYNFTHHVRGTWVHLTGLLDGVWSKGQRVCKFVI